MTKKQPWYGFIANFKSKPTLWGILLIVANELLKNFEGFDLNNILAEASGMDIKLITGVDPLTAMGLMMMGMKNRPSKER
ncbi:MAG: hypothetical protein EXR21_10405 [Flavobacteriaceae bacterium]|nr:hypothetical protein [Flavobacteriaceae bacterium]